MKADLKLVHIILKWLIKDSTFSISHFLKWDKIFIFIVFGPYMKIFLLLKN